MKPPFFAENKNHMKKLLWIPFLLIAVIGNTQPLDRSFENANGSIKLLGQVTLERLAQGPFDEWYNKNHSEYTVDTNPLTDVTLPDSITLFMGTWCGDSKREVPRFIKILESKNYDMDRLKIVCLNTGFQNYKQAPEREERGVNIHRVPTFIFHDGEGEEIGRIVEEAVVSFEEDIKTVLNGEEYATAYPAVADLIEKFENHSLKELRKMMPKLKDEYKKIAASEYELNTYGYMLWTSFDLVKAEFVFELNSAAFPKVARHYQTLARFKNSLGKEKEALSTVNRGLKMEPEHEALGKMKEEMVASK